MALRTKKNVVIDIPYKFTLRPYQEPFYRYMSGGGRRAVCVWHRRAGKDKTFLNWCISAMAERVGAYYYYFPTQAQGRKILWEGIDKNGMRFLDHFPKAFVKVKKDHEMMIESVNGSIFRVVGTDKSEVVGPNPVGCVFSEYSLQNPSAWNYVRPILAENDGWAVFNFTPRGKNHGFDLYSMAKDNPDWFCERLTVNDTKAVTELAIDEERRAGMSEDMIQQEFYCSFDLGAEGSYYAKLVAAAYNDSPPRVGFVPVDNTAKTYTFWDLGVDDCTAIWFVQFIQNRINIIDCYENHHKGLDEYVKVIRDKGYIYGGHWLPWDAVQQQQGEQITSRLVTLRRLIPDPIGVVSKHGIADGIEAGRGILPKCWFDEIHCAAGLKALENYRQKYDETTHAYSSTPLHDGNSHFADAFRYLGVQYRYGQIGEKNLGGVLPETDKFYGAYENESEDDLLRMGIGVYAEN